MVDPKLLVIVGHDRLWEEEDWLRVVGQSCDVYQNHLLTQLVNIDGGRSQGSCNYPGSLQLGIHENELLDEEMASASHSPSLRKHISETVLLAIDLETKPVVYFEESFQSR